MDVNDPNLTRVEQVEPSDPRLGRQIVHDRRSLAFPLQAAAAVDKTTWRDKVVAIYDPRPNPNQTVGNCTMCAKAMQMNSVHNRKPGVVLDMKWAMDGYHLETTIDPFPGAYPPDDTGSSSLASCKAAQQLGVGGEYQWVLNGADGVVQAIMAGHAISVGTWWYQSMFSSDTSKYGVRRPVISPAGSTKAGGHQYIARGYDLKRDLVLLRCWWGSFKDVWIARTDLDALLADGGDAHWQARA